MQRLYTLSEITNIYVPGGYKAREWDKVYSRLNRAVSIGVCGQTQRIVRGWLLTERQVEMVARYMEEEWGMTLPQAPVAQVG